MKKMLFLSLMLLISTCIFSQTVKKGSLLGLHKGTVTLSPNVTMAQFKDYYFNVYGAEFTKLFKVKMLEVAGIRGADAKKMIMNWPYYTFLSQKQGTISSMLMVN